MAGGPQAQRGGEVADALDRISKGHPAERINELLPWSWL
jgi:hypothetical protein